MNNGTSAPGPLLSIRGLVKEFTVGDFPRREILTAVDGVDLDVRRGSIHSVIGPNGAGKTTLFRLLTGILRPSAGTLHFGGAEVPIPRETWTRSSRSTWPCGWKS